jgi:hypothetical protein
MVALFSSDPEVFQQRFAADEAEPTGGIPCRQRMKTPDYVPQVAVHETAIVFFRY